MAHLTSCCVYVFIPLLIPLSHVVKFSSCKIHVQSRQRRRWRVDDEDIRAIKPFSHLFYVSNVDFE